MFNIHHNSIIKHSIYQPAGGELHKNSSEWEVAMVILLSYFLLSFLFVCSCLFVTKLNKLNMLWISISNFGFLNLVAVHCWTWLLYLQLLETLWCRYLYNIRCRLTFLVIGPSKILSTADSSLFVAESSVYIYVHLCSMSVFWIVYIKHDFEA